MLGAWGGSLRVCGGLFSSVLFERCCVNCGILPNLPPGTLSAQVGFVEFILPALLTGLEVRDLEGC